MRTFTHAACLEHTAPAGYPERPERLRRILEHLRAAGREVVDVAAGGGSEPAPSEGELDAAVRAVHDGAYVERFERAVGRGDGLLDSADNPLGPKTWEAARAAVGASLAAAAFAADGGAAFAAVRPPGHHAERDRAMGFCYFNNAAVAAQFLIDHRGCERLAILDFDVHHGNGTQHLFEERADVLYASLHQYPFYPGTGAAGEKGRGPGEGATLNVPLAAGADDAVYRRAFEGEVLPALRAHQPEVLIVSAGFDAWRGDPLGGMRVSRRGYAEWGRLLGELAAEACGGRSLSLLEGGYDVAELPALVEAYLAGLLGEKTAELT